MSSPLNVLILEDSQADALLIAYELTRAGLMIEWTRVDNRDEFETEIYKQPDVILADYSLPQFDAMRALRLMKESGLDIPFIVISGTSSEELMVQCIEEGANDYLLKDRLMRLGAAVQQALDDHRLRKEKQRTEQALSESETKYRSLFMESREGIFTANLRGIITESNPAFAEMVGFERDEIIGQRVSDFFADKSFLNRLTEMREAVGFARNVEIDIIRKDGELRHFLFTGSIVKSSKGVPQSALGIARDITERKRSQREMEVMITVNAALRTAPNSKTMAPVVADIVSGVSRAEGVALVLKDSLTGEFQTEALAGVWAKYPDFSIELDPVVRENILESGTSRQWEAPFDAPELKLSLPSTELGSIFCVPMQTGQEQIGLIWYGCKAECPEESLRLVEVIAGISANAIHRATLHENNYRSLQESEALANISRILNQNLNLETIFEQIVREAVGIIPDVFRSVIHLYDEKNERLHAVALSWVEDDVIETRSLIHIRVSPKNEFDFGVLADEDIQAAKMHSGEGVAGKVIETGMPMIVHDTNADPRFLQTNEPSSIRSILVAPILSGSLRLGTLSVLGNKANEFSLVDQNLVERLCTQVSIAIENARLLEAERRQSDLAKAQAEISALLNESLEMDEVMAGVLNHMMRYFNASAANIMLVDGDAIRVVRHLGYPGYADPTNYFAIPLDKLEEYYPMIYKVYQTKEIIVSNDLSNEMPEDYQQSTKWIHSHICVPLISNDAVIGVLNLDSDRERAFDELETEQLESFANSTVVAVENARLYTDLEQSLATEKATRSQLIQADKLAGMGRMVASVAHELNNPLQTIKNCLFLIEQTFDEPEDVDLLELAMSEVERLTSIVNRLRDVYRPVRNNQFVSTELKPVMAELEKLLETHLRRNRVTLQMDANEAIGICVQAFPDQLKQVFLNLSLNAIEAMQPDGGELKILISKDQKDAFVSFSDTGSGIHDEDLSVIFDPFYTTKESGMGLGLSICYDIVHNHNGSIWVENNPEKGVTFTVSLPLN